ncbi:hypothetical protein SPBR_01959 [Sporothrix brasiliensis 5110]|uniref:Isochorismatase-like domain-containing protein n=1 Tax=Sporothrix brasiliensis 5110 TaxID=1398154 RepID=A0A0C2EYV0_9PEZI|nr:uncharacterized protein SPBR_01959 [Sporothrix brasiliensis 5110]KIH91639.1 hypothetical protein SPBR_01959 [Sporothrix brasiliensis 5110]
MATVHGNVLRMGPAGDQWYYHRKERLYDLTRGYGKDGHDGKGDQLPAQDATVTISTTTGPSDTRIALAPSQTALVIVDMQNFFLHRRCRDHPTGRAAVAPTLAAIDSCRRAGIRVICLNWGLTDHHLATVPAAVVAGFSRMMVREDADKEPTPSGLGVDRGDGCGRWLVKGEWNSNVYEGEGEGDAAVDNLSVAVQPDLGDVLCDKTRMSGMWSDDAPLRQYLTELTTIRTLLFAGVNTDQCVLGTLTDAYNGGWDCVAVADCCATTSPHGQELTMFNVAVSSGFSL